MRVVWNAAALARNMLWCEGEVRLSPGEGSACGGWLMADVRVMVARRRTGTWFSGPSLPHMRRRIAFTGLWLTGNIQELGFYFHLTPSLSLPACLLVTTASFDCRHFDDDQEKSSAFVHHLHMLYVRRGSSGSLRPSKSQMASGGWQLHLVVIALDIPTALRSKCCRDESSASPPEDQGVSQLVAHDPGCAASFATFDLLATYSPNNGSDPESFARRAAWDKALNEAVVQRNRPLLWIGDLNVAAERIDVTHPDWFAQQCYQGEPADMRGQPGFTEGERRRFKELLVTGKLVDAYRRLHPSDDVPSAAGPYFTWRGHPPVHQTVAKYHGKGMRIDYALVAEEMLTRLEACDILGQGADRNGFLGSDHCPLRCTLQKESSAGSAPIIAAVEQPSTLSSQEARL
ncbi:APE1L [Symbiodinium sp. CCMP2592]|nr:APE1L [Symbiodinium sp. CCMP2592]